MEEFLDSVYRQMRLATGIGVSVQVLNYLLAFSVAALSIWLWTRSAISVGAIAVAISGAAVKRYGPVDHVGSEHVV